MKSKRIKNSIYLLFISLILLFAFPISASAQILDKDFNRNYTVTDEFVSISETKSFSITNPSYFISEGSFESFTIFFPIKNDPEAENKKAKTLESITISDSYGRNLSFDTLEQNEASVVIGVKFPQNIVYSQSYTLSLNYNAYGLLVNTGNIRDVYIPAFSENYVFSNEQYIETVKTSIRIPKNLGEINFVSVPHLLEETESETVVTIDSANLVGNPAWIQVGTTQYYSFELTQPYDKTTQIPFYMNTITFPIPRNIVSGPINQKVYFESFSTKPSRIYKDEEENLIAEFKIPANQTSEVKINGYVEITQTPNFSKDNWGNISDIQMKNALNESEYWEVNAAEIVQTAKDLKTSDSVYEQTLKTYNFVIDKIDYSTVKRFGLNERQGALKTLEGGAAVCMEYSDLFITLMRAQGIPARAAFGYGYSTLDYDSSENNTVNHQWAEVYAPSLDTWVSIDTTWGDGGLELIGGDLNHVYFHVASQSPIVPSSTAIKYLGSLNEIPEKSTSVVAIEQIPLTNLKTQEEVILEFSSYSKAQIAKDIYTNTIEFINDNSPVTTSKTVYEISIWVIIAVFFLLILLSIKILLETLLHLSRKFLYTKDSEDKN